MSAYILFDNLAVRDPAKLEAYKAAVKPVVERFGGRYLVLGGRFEAREGTWKPRFPVMLEFPSYDQARRWYDSDDYRELKALRLASGHFNAVLIEGLVAPRSP
jgi:uncharacterized protein (DUF1330 family)